MEFALSSATTSTTTAATTLFISRLHRHSHKPHLTRFLRSQLIHRRFKSLVIYNSSSSFPKSNVRSSTSSYSPWSLCAAGVVVPPPIGSRLRCVSSSADSFAFGHGGGGGGGGESGGFGGGGSGRGDAKANAVSGGAEEVSAIMPDVIILDVEGMTCGGCAASVKRILESQPQVSSASVNLTTETAVIWPISEAKVIPNWQKELGEALAKHLTTCGFKSNLRGQEAIEGDIPY